VGRLPPFPTRRASDLSVVQERMDRGELTSDEARVHPYRHMVTRALGAGPEADPDYWLIPAETGDRMLVCSDGLTSIRSPVSAGRSEEHTSELESRFEL